MVRKSSIVVLDFETQNNPWYGELASPRCPDNYVVMYGYRVIEVTQSGRMRLLERQTVKYSNLEDFMANKSLHLPDDCNMIVAHNAPYEIDWFLYHYREEYEGFLLRGGRVFCTAYAEYLLSHQQERYPALDEVAPKYGGSHKVDGIKLLWDQGYLTSEIDPVMLEEYLSGDEGDVENTTKVFLGQWAALAKADMLRMALIRMEGMLAWSECMANGLKVDREVANKLLEDAQQEYNTLVQEVLQKLPVDMPEAAREQFKFSSHYAMSAFIFGGVFKYEGRVERTDKDGNYIYVKVDAPYFKGLRSATNTDVEFDEATGLWFHTPTQEHQATYISGKNKGLPKFERVDTDEVDLKNGDLLYTLEGLAPLHSLPRELRETAEREWTGKRSLADGTPVYSTSEEVLEVLAARGIDGVVQLNKIAKLDKVIGTYYYKETKNAEGEVTKVSGAMQYIQPDDIIYHTLNMTSTVTTRLSGNKPNMQNIPRSSTSPVKAMFNSRFGSEGSVMEADYSALEVVGLCAYAKDKNLEKALLSNTDMHCLRLAESLGESYESVLEKCKNEDHPEHSRYAIMRENIKPKAFQYQYGATAYGIAFSTGCSVDEAQEFIDNEKAMFPDVERFFDEVVQPTVAETGAKTIHREQMEDGSWSIYRRGYWRAPDGTCYSFREWPRRIQGQLVNQYKPTEMRNYPIQGSTAFWVQGIGGLIYRYLLKQEHLKGKVYFINQVHDAFYFDVHNSVLDEVALIVKSIMECLPDYFNHLWPEYNMQIPFPAAVDAGPSMHDSHGVKVDPVAVDNFKRTFLEGLGVKYAS